MHKLALPVIAGNNFEGAPVFGVVVDDFFIVDPFTSQCGRFVVDAQEAYGLSEEDAGALVCMNNALKAATEEAINAGCLSIQKALAIYSGDVAGLFFAGEDAQLAVARSMQAYLAAEYAEVKGQARQKSTAPAGGEKWGAEAGTVHEEGGER